MKAFNKMIYEQREEFFKNLSISEQRRLIRLENKAKYLAKQAKKEKTGPIVELGTTFTALINFADGTETLTFELMNLPQKLLLYEENGLALESKLGQAVIGKAIEEQFSYIGKDQKEEDYEVTGVIIKVKGKDYEGKIKEVKMNN